MGQGQVNIAVRPPLLPWARLFVRAAVSVGLMMGFLWLLSGRLAQINVAALMAAFGQLQVSQWGAALAFTGLSFWAVGRYDSVLHQHFTSGMPCRMTRRAGICAIAVSQTLGLGLVSGAIVRWRMLPGATLWQATRLTAAVALSFLAGWAVVTSVVLLARPDAPYRPWAALVLVIALGLFTLSLAAPRLHRLRFRWPNALTMTRLMLLCAVDTLAAAAAFHALVPNAVDLPYDTLLPAFLLAPGAGLALGTPGGMGPFEITLLAHLPQVDQPALLAAILAWRLIYFALPAVVGAAIAIAFPGHTLAAPPPARLPQNYPAEAGLTRQGPIELGLVARRAWLLGRSNHCLIALLDPMGARRPAQFDRALRGLRQLAWQEGRLPVAYKASARLAARAAKAGQIVRHTGWEAWINPQTHDLSASRFSGLRRKLRRAEAADVSVTQPLAHMIPWTALDRIAADWTQCHGPERGFSMGRHARTYLETQRLYIAWAGNTPIAYVSFHTAPKEWTLDLMRHGTTLPDGTMHSLIAAAVSDAKETGLHRLSLAAVPNLEQSKADILSRFILAFAPKMSKDGLYQFKSAFAPHWQPLYLIAPNRVTLALASLSLWRAITRPPPIMRQIERDDADYGFASGPAAWHIARDNG